MHIFSVFPFQDPSTYLFPHLLVTNLYYFFQVSDYPTKPLATIRELVWMCTSGHVSDQTQWTTKCTICSSHREDFLASLLFRFTTESTFGGIQYILQTYIYKPGLIVFLG